MIRSFFLKSTPDKIKALKIRWRRLVHLMFKDLGIEYTIPYGLKYYAYSDWVGTDRVISGRFDRKEVLFMNSYLKPGMVCIDVGAHYGFYTLQMARLVGRAGKVISCEPSKKNRERLAKNISSNHFEQVEVMPVAVSNQEGEATLFLADHNTGENTLLSKQHIQYKEQYEVKVQTLDKLISGLSLHRVDFIKIDVENHEYAVLEGAEESIKRYYPTILIELWEVYNKPWGSQLVSEKSITKLLNQYGYQWCTINNSGSLSLVQEGDVRAQNNYIAMHQSKLDQVYIE